MKKIIFGTLLLFAAVICFANPLYVSPAGEGVRIAVPAPVLNSSSGDDLWIPQMFQDLITSDLKTYSAMTVIDRQNESLMKAEQRHTEDSAYSENDAIEIGKWTQAAYVVVGNIINMGNSRYSVSFRVNNLETNEIVSSFSGTYFKSDIESSGAEKDCVKKLLDGLGIKLTPQGDEELSKIQLAKANATANLAKALTAETKNKNIVEAIAYYTEALENDSSITEAAERLQKLQGSVASGNLRDDIKNDIARRKEWIKIYSELNDYLKKNSIIFVYDPDEYTDEVNYERETVSLTFKGKRIINKTALGIIEEIENGLDATEKREVWGRENFDLDAFNYNIEISLLDENSKAISNETVSLNSSMRQVYEYSKEIEEMKKENNSYGGRYEEYFNKLLENDFEFTFSNIPVNSITDKLILRIDSVKVWSRDSRSRRSTEEIPFRTYTAEGWFEYKNSINQDKSREYAVDDDGPAGGIIVFAAKNQNKGVLLNGEKYKYLEVLKEPVEVKNLSADKVNKIKEAVKKCRTEQEFTVAVHSLTGKSQKPYIKNGVEWFIGNYECYKKIDSAHGFYTYDELRKGVGVIVTNIENKTLITFGDKCFMLVEDDKILGPGTDDVKVKYSDVKPDGLCILYVRGFN